MLLTRRVVSSLGCSGTAVTGTAASVDRGRVGERLQATLAGLHELQLLRKKHERLVQEALKLHEEPAGPQRAVMDKPGDPYTEEERLEATLAVLKEQLSRLRRQDVGLKSHLQQLDQQLSELKLDVNKASTEHLESDSRPSSGFYELSDGGSCSLSNSCSSVYSECMSSSHSSIPPSSQQPRSRISMLEYRPRSADETTVHSICPQQGVHIRAGCRIRTSPDFSGNPATSRQRPVSTGDLEKMMPPGLGFQKASDPKSVSPLCNAGNINLRSVDSKYQSDLVSKSGNDTYYYYPSPLHAVALQSPLFSLAGDSPNTDSNKVSQEAMASVAVSNSVMTEALLEIKPGSYINKLIQLSKYKLKNPPNVGCRDAEKNQPTVSYQADITTVNPAKVNINNTGQLSMHDDPSRNINIIKFPKSVPEKETNRQQELTHCLNRVTSGGASEGSKPFQPAESNTMDMTANTDARNYTQKTSGSCLQSHPLDNKQDTMLSKPALSKKVSQKPSGDEILRKSYRMLPNSEFVHARFVPAGSHQIKGKQAGSKTKAAKIKRRNSDKQRTVRQISSAKPKDCHDSTRIPIEKGHQIKYPVKQSIGRRPTFAGEVSNRTCSESTLYPVQYKHPHLIPRPEFYRPSAYGLYAPEAVNAEAAKRKQRKWLSAVEISAKVHHTNIVSGAGMGLVHLKQPIRKAGVLRTVSLRARPGHYRHSIPSCARSDSEYSAECASLFHSTIVETSEDETSNYTTNRFGDSESSESDSDVTSNSSLSVDYDETDESELVWPEASVGPASSKLIHTESKMCRIKASKALKKRIRRFQPASLKVMTMV